MTVEELKAETAKLSVDARRQLAEWIEESEDVRNLRRDELIRDLQVGVDQADRGDLTDADAVFAKLRQISQDAG